MKAIAVVPGTPGARIGDRPEPWVSAPDDVKRRMIGAGICGTGREELSGGRLQAPDGQKEPVIGHERFGQVVDAGATVTRANKGEYQVFTVRRECGECPP